jgi:phospholipid/cholesterol/gamma-HCH transport system substrate-binding protein
MITRSQKIRLGIFVSISFITLLITISIIVAPKFFEVKDNYFIGYKDISVTGLQKGGAVKYHGLSVGHIRDIYIDPEDIRRVIVEISLNHGTPIKKDTYANIVILGITGLKLIELRGGSNEAEPLKPGKFIKTGKSAAETITGKAEIIAEKAELTLNSIAAFTTEENREKIFTLITNTSNTMGDLHTLLHKNRTTLDRTLVNIEHMTYEFQKLASTTNNTMRNIELLSQSDSLKQVIGNLAQITTSLKKANLIQFVKELNISIAHTNNILKEVDATLSKSRTDLGFSVQALKESAENLNQFTRMLAEDPSILVRGTKPQNAPDFKLEK